MKPRAGNKIHNGKQVPINAEILFNDELGKFYITGIDKAKGVKIYMFNSDNFKTFSFEEFELLQKESHLKVLQSKII